MHMCDNPKIYTGRVVQGGKDNLKGYAYRDKEELVGDLLVIGL